MSPPKVGLVYTLETQFLGIEDLLSKFSNPFRLPHMSPGRRAQASRGKA